MKERASRRNVFPNGWNERRVRQVLDFYERQTESEAVAEYEAAQKDRSMTVMLIPSSMVPLIRQLLAYHKPSRRRRTA